MAKWNEYGLKSGTSAEDEVLILDSDTNTNKRTTVGDIQEFANGKMLEKENSTLNTEAKTLIGAINEVDAKNDAQDTKIEEVENKFSDYLKKTDVDSTLLISGSPADAKVVGEQLKKSGEAVADLADKKITKFYASNQGNTHLPDSDKGKIQDMFLYGKSEQVQYKGKNLLKATAKTQTVNGVTLTNNGDGTYTLNGTATERAEFIIDVFNIDISKKYKIIAFTKERTYINCFVQLNQSPWTIYGTSADSQVTITDSKNIRLVIAVIKNNTLSNEIIKPMIVDASLYPDTTYDDYEPYVGGIPSPNPDYPQEIKAVVNPVIKVCGSNIYDYENAKASNTVLSQNGEESVSPGYITSDYIPILDGIYIKTNNYNGKVDPLRIGLYAKKNEWKIRKDIVNSTLHILSSDAKFVKLSYSKSDVAEIYVSYSNIFEPYTEQSTTLPYTLYAIPVSTGGNITIGNQQYVADYVDVERGKLVRMCKYKKFLSEDVNIIGGNKSLLIRTDEIWDVGGNYTKRTLNALCSIGIARLETVADSGWVGKGKLKIGNIQFTNINEAINYFNNHDVYGCYPIPTSEEIDLTPEQIQAFKSIATNYPVTNIEVSSDQLDGYTVFNYPISMAEGWNYVKQQIGDTRDYIYDMDLQSAEAYVNSEYAVALTELEVM